MLPALLSFLVAACSFTEARPGLDIAVPRKFDRAAAVPVGPIPADWPKLFGSPELDRLGQITVTGNLDVAAAAARIIQADAQTDITSAALFPRVTGDTDASRAWSPGTIRSKRGPFTTTVSNNFQLGLTASYEVDLWGKNRFAAIAAEDNAVSTRFARDTLVLSSVAATVNAYFSLLSAQDRLKIAGANLKAARELLDAIKGRLEVGTVTALEVAEQQSVVDQQLASFSPLQQQAQQAKTAIAILAGRTPESLKVKGGSLNALKPPAIPAGVPSQLLRRRPDVAEFEAALASGDASVQSARAAMFPSVSLTASGGLESLLLKTLLRPEAAFGNLAAGVTQPLLDGGALQGQLTLERGRDLEELQSYRKAVIQALVDVENALIAIQQNTEHEKRLADVVASSQRAYDITLARLKLGTIDIVTVLNTEQTLFAAQDALAVARLARFTATASLAQALGGGWTRPAAVVLPPSPRPGSGAARGLGAGPCGSFAGAALVKRFFALTLILLVGAVVLAERFPFIHERVPWLPPIPSMSSVPSPESGVAGSSPDAPARGGARGRRFAADGPIPVLVAPSRYADVPVTADVLGTVQATNSVTVRSQVDGKLVEIDFKEGQEVKKGDVIARIDPVTFKAVYDQAVAKKAQDEAQLANAQVDLVRYQKLAETQYGSHQQADTQKALVAQYSAQIQQDQASVDNAKATLDYATIRAPIEGRTGLRLVDQGNIVHASDITGIVTIAQVKPIATVFNLPQQWLRQVNKAIGKGPLRLEARDDASADVLDTGTLDVVDNNVDQTTGTVKLKGSFPNTGVQLWPGQFVNVRLYVDTLSHVVVVPTAAVQRGPDGAFVYVANNDAVTLTKVTIGRQTETDTVVTAGLEPPAVVVTTGFTRLTDGAKIAVGPPGPAIAPERGAAPEGAAPADKPQDGSKPAGAGRRSRRKSGGAGEATQ